jgi:hypothetical protein
MESGISVWFVVFSLLNRQDAKDAKDAKVGFMELSRLCGCKAFHPVHTI